MEPAESTARGEFPFTVRPPACTLGKESIIEVGRKLGQRVARHFFAITWDDVCVNLSASAEFGEGKAIIQQPTRNRLVIDVARSLKSEDVLERLSDLFVRRGVPQYLRSDNGSEFTATKVREWLARVGVTTLFIEPGSPWENGYVERFNGKLRDEVLAREQFDTLLEAKVLIERWRQTCDTVRPHSSLGYRPPVPEANEADWRGDKSHSNLRTGSIPGGRPVYTYRPKDKAQRGAIGKHATRGPLGTSRSEFFQATSALGLLVQCSDRD